MSQTEHKGVALSPSLRQVELDMIASALADLKYGSLTIVVQDGVVVQIDRTEKQRLRIPSSS